MEELNLKVLQNVPHKQMVALVNQYLINTTDTINKQRYWERRVAFFAEEQMMKIDDYIEYVQNKVMLLESKLASAGSPTRSQQPAETKPQEQAPPQQ